MRSDVVVGIFVLLELTIMCFNREVDIVDFIELLSVCSVSSLHTPIEFGRAWRQLKKKDIFFLASLLKLVLKLRAAIDLDGVKFHIILTHNSHIKLPYFSHSVNEVR